MADNLPPLCADCLEIWGPQPPGTPRACPGLYRDCFTFFFICLRKLLVKESDEGRGKEIRGTHRRYWEEARAI
jgi:hypothetical protein